MSQIVRIIVMNFIITGVLAYAAMCTAQTQPTWAEGRSHFGIKTLLNHLIAFYPMFIGRKTRYSALFTFWLGGMPVMLLAALVQIIIFCLHWKELTNLSTNIDFYHNCRKGNCHQSKSRTVKRLGACSLLKRHID